MGDGQLHGTALRLRSERIEGGLTAAQEWLWDALVSELEYRWRAHRTAWLNRCHCDLCES